MIDVERFCNWVVLIGWFAGRSELRSTGLTVRHHHPLQWTVVLKGIQNVRS